MNSFIDLKGRKFAYSLVYNEPGIILEREQGTTDLKTPSPPSLYGITCSAAPWPEIKRDNSKIQEQIIKD